MVDKVDLATAVKFFMHYRSDNNSFPLSSPFSSPDTTGRW